MPDTAFFDSYDAVEIRLPNRPVMRCRAFTISEAAQFLRYMDDARAGDRVAGRRVFATLPDVIAPRRILGRFVYAFKARKHGWTPRRRLRRFLNRVRGDEVLDVLNLFFPDPPEIGGPSQNGGPKNKKSHATFDDLIAEYAAAYGGPPPATLPYPLFVALVGRGARFEARRILNAMTATNWGMAGSNDGEVGAEKTRLVGLAYPGGARAAVTFALKQSKDD